jgi:hypothetical protein
MISCKVIEWALRLLRKREIRSTITHPHLNEMPPNHPRRGRGDESATAAHSPLHNLKTKAPQIRKQRTSHWRIPRNNLREVGMDAWDELVVDLDENVAQSQPVLYSMTRSKLGEMARSYNKRE